MKSGWKHDLGSYLALRLNLGITEMLIKFLSQSLSISLSMYRSGLRGIQFQDHSS